MGAHQDSSLPQLRQTKSIWIILSTLVVSLFLFFTAAAYHVSYLNHVQKNQAAAAISEITALIESHKSGLAIRDVETAELEARSISSFFSGLASSIGSGVEAAGEKAASDIGLGNITSLVNTVKGLFSANASFIENLVGQLADPAKFLGMGLAQGGLSALNLSTSMNTTASGLDKIAMNLGSGLTSTIFSNSGAAKMFSGKSAVQDTSSKDSAGGFLGGSSGTLGQAVLALSQGIGSGALTGLKLNTAPTGAAFNTSGLSGIAGNFGQGLTSTLLGGLSLPSLSLPSLMSATKRDVDLEVRSKNTDFLTTMRREFDARHSNTKRDDLSSALGALGLVGTISDLALGLGTGLGQGTAVGLGFQNTSAANTRTAGLGGITQNFGLGLTSSFLTQDTLSKIIKMISSNSALPPIDVAKAAEGLAVGLISGAGSQVPSLQLIDANTSSFNDSVDGAATGFGRGLGSEGAKLVSAFMSNGLPKGLSLKKRDGESVIVHLAGESSRARPRGGALMDRQESTTTTTTALTTNATDIASVITSLNASSINPLLQTGVNALSCSGVGGLVGVLFGLRDSKTINLESSKSSTTSTSSINLPNQLFIVRSAGNTYSLNPSQGLDSATVNGFSLGTILFLGGVHIIFAIAAWFIAIPLLLLFSSTSKLALFFLPANKAPAATTSFKTQKYLFWTIISLALLGFVFGVVIVGTSAHMRGAHQILALILLLITIISGIAHLKLNPSLMSSPSPTQTSTATWRDPKSPPSKNLRLAYRGLIAVLFVMAMATLLTGFGDLTALSMCIVQELISVPGLVAIGMAIMATWMLAIGVYGLKKWAIFRFRPKILFSTENIYSTEKIPVEFEYQGQGVISSKYTNESIEISPVSGTSSDASFTNTIRAEIVDGRMVEKSFMKLDA